jgi:hypothetical protein
MSTTLLILRVRDAVFIVAIALDAEAHRVVMLTRFTRHGITLLSTINSHCSRVYSNAATHVSTWC